MPGRIFTTEITEDHRVSNAWKNRVEKFHSTGGREAGAIATETKRSAAATFRKNLTTNRHSSVLILENLISEHS